MTKSHEEWSPDERGRYRRKLGFVMKDEKRKLQLFYLGTDLDQAKGRYLRLRELWSHIEKRWTQPKTRNPNDLGWEEFQTKPVEECVWSDAELWIARELASGRVQIIFEREKGQNAHSYHASITYFAQLYPMVNFVPADRAAYDEGTEFMKHVVKREVSDLRSRAPEVFVDGIQNILPKESASLHEALNAYIKHIKLNDLEPTNDGPQVTPYAILKMEQAKRIKERSKDQPLTALDYDGCQKLLDIWRMRPMRKAKKGRKVKPMTRKTCQNHIAELGRFFRWLHKEKSFPWRKPEDYDDLRTNVKDIQDERTSIDFLQVIVYSLEELALLNKYATPLERVLLLLGLNCGFRGAEQGTLLIRHLFIDKPHPHARMLKELAKFEIRRDDQFILYSRNKSRVYGEFLLWRQTKEAIQWALERRNEVCERLGLSLDNVLLTKDGLRFYRRTGGNKNSSQIFANKWTGLTKRIQKDHPNFPSLPFSTLRDTGSNRIRQISNGEVAAVFLCHGKPVKPDDLLDLYTNRPFGKVFEALRTIEAELQPVFDAAPDDPWAKPVQQYTSLGKKEQIIKLHRMGKKPSEIAELVGVSKMTVYRKLEPLFMKKPKS